MAGLRGPEKVSGTGGRWKTAGAKTRVKIFRALWNGEKPDKIAARHRVLREVVLKIRRDFRIREEKERGVYSHLMKLKPAKIAGTPGEDARKELNQKIRVIAKRCGVHPNYVHARWKRLNERHGITPELVNALAKDAGLTNTERIALWLWTSGGKGAAPKNDVEKAVLERAIGKIQEAIEKNTKGAGKGK